MLKLIFATLTLFVFQANAQPFEEETGVVNAIYNSSRNDFEIHYLDAPRAGDVGGRGFQVCPDKKPSMSLKSINETIQYSKQNNEPVFIRHTNTCVDSVTTMETGTVETIYSDGSFGLRYLDAPRAGSVSGRIFSACKGDEKPGQSLETINQAAQWALADKNLKMTIYTYAGSPCIYSVKLSSRN